MWKRIDTKFKNFRWIFFVSKRLSRVDSKGRTAAASILSSLGIGFGVMALIVVMSVMNGFQMSFIDSIMEISSYHVQCSNVENEDDFFSWCSKSGKVRNIVPFYQAQGLLVSDKGSQCAALIRSVDFERAAADTSFLKELNVFSGSFDLSCEEDIVIGNTIAYKMGIRVGDKINVAAMSGSSDAELTSSSRIFKVKGIFYSGYGEINESFCFVNLDAGKKYFGSKTVKTYGIKIYDSNEDNVFIYELNKSFPDVKSESWRSFNRSFFGALRIEKNILLLLVLLIFIVVGINIYNSMKKLIYERREEIAVLASLGGSKMQIENIFVFQSFATGIKGALPGLLCGIFICRNMKEIFIFLEKSQYYIEYFFYKIFSPESLAGLTFNKMFVAYSNIPARIFPFEAVMIFLFGLLSSVAAALIAGKGILKMSVTEVLRDE